MSSILTRWSATATLLLVAHNAFAQQRPSADELSAKIDALAKPYVESDTVVGMTIGVVRGDDTVVRGYGRLSADDSRTPDGRTVYGVGSVTKVFTGLLLADAVVSGRATLDTPVQKLLPKSVRLNERDAAQPIRLVHLATHVSGLPRLPDNLDTSNPDPYGPYGGAELAEFLRSYAPKKRPGERSTYSNLGAGLLGLVLARQQKTSYASAVERRIAEPLGLADTAATLDDNLAERLAPGHQADRTPTPRWTFDALAGAGAVYSTADDLVRFARAQLDPPEGDLGSAIELAWRVHQPPIDESDFALGLGWHVARDGQTRWHNGQTGGYHAAVFINRELDAAAVVLTNTATGEVDQLAAQVLRASAGMAEAPRVFERPTEVAEDTMRRYEGVYQLAPTFLLTVKVDAGRLMIGATGQPTFEVYARSDTEWFYKIIEATLTFEVNDAGEAVALTLDQAGVQQRAPKID